jgi:ABC-2 type transport system ATP-binding protein
MIRELLIRLAHDEGKTVLITTHNMFEAEIVCDRVAIINDGRIIAVDTIDNLKGIVGGDLSIELSILPSARISLDNLRPHFSDLNAELTLDGDDIKLKVLTKPSERDEVTQELLLRLQKLGCSVKRVEVREPNLEDVFIELTRGRS